jgi:hypothetical protein
MRGNCGQYLRKNKDRLVVIDENPLSADEKENLFNL